MLAVADESFFSSSRMAVLTNGLLSFDSAAVQIGNDGYYDDKTSPSIVFPLETGRSKLSTFTLFFRYHPQRSTDFLSPIEPLATNHKQFFDKSDLTHTHPRGARFPIETINDDYNDTDEFLPALAQAYHALFSLFPSSATNYGFFGVSKFA